MEVKATLWIVADLFGVTGLLFAAMNFNLSLFEQVVTWVLLTLLGYYRLRIMRENYISKKLDNQAKKIDTLIKQENFDDKHKQPLLKK